MASRYYINMSAEDIVLGDVKIPAQDEEGLVIAEVSESIITEEYELYLDELVETGALIQPVVVASGSPEEEIIRQQMPDLKPVDREDFKAKWYKDKINPELDAEPTEAPFQFAEETPRDRADEGWRRVKAQSDKSKMNSREGLNHDKEVSKQIKSDGTSIYFPKDANGEDITTKQPIYDNRNLYSKKAEREAMLSQKIAESKEAKASGIGVSVPQNQVDSASRMAEPSNPGLNPLVAKILSERK